ncbi:hypothetical protein [Hyphococcus sp.]|uniref:hypothetical protein n=1 Tax=Hyphococcus sp. TaxID=2038636 RepID=UPI00208B78D4|nr:MAG: hypothetical protein DHS20C04_27360 [Marinicaulis sp.]
MNNNDFPPEGERCLDVEKVLAEAAQRILTDAVGRFPTMTLADAERFARITWRAGDEEMVNIGCLDAADMMEVDATAGPVCGDCRSKAH